MRQRQRRGAAHESNTNMSRWTSRLAPHKLLRPSGVLRSRPTVAVTSRAATNENFVLWNVLHDVQRPPSAAVPHRRGVLGPSGCVGLPATPTAHAVMLDCDSQP